MLVDCSMRMPDLNDAIKQLEKELQEQTAETLRLQQRVDQVIVTCLPLSPNLTTRPVVWVCAHRTDQLVWSHAADTRL